MTGNIKTSAPRDERDPLSSWAESPLFHASRLCIVFLQELFRNAPEGDFRWSESEEFTNIVITPTAPIKLRVLNKRPAIVLIRSGVGFAGLGLDNLREEDLKTGLRTHTDLASGNFTFNCISRQRVEAEYLAWIVTRHIMILRRLLMRSGFHEVGSNMQISPPSPPGAIISGDTEAEMVNVATTTPFRFQWTDTIQEKDLALHRKVEMGITARIAFVQTTPVRMGMIGTAPNAVVPDMRNILRQPSLGGVVLQTRSMPGSQPAEPPTSFRVNIGEDHGGNT